MEWKEVEPKSKSQIIKETVIGSVVFLIGLAVMFVPMLVLEEVSKIALLLGTGFITFGLYNVNKKVSVEFINTLRDSLPFLEDTGNDNE